MSVTFSPRVSGERAETVVPWIDAHPGIFHDLGERGGEIAPGAPAFVGDASGCFRVEDFAADVGIDPQTVSVDAVQTVVAQFCLEQHPVPLQTVFECFIAEITGGGFEYQQPFGGETFCSDGPEVFRVCGVHRVQIDRARFENVKRKFRIRASAPRMMIHHAVQQVESVCRIMMCHAHVIFPVSGRLGDITAFGIGFFEQCVAPFHECFDFFGVCAGRHVAVIRGKRIVDEAVAVELPVGIGNITDHGGVIPHQPDRFDCFGIGQCAVDRGDDQKAFPVEQFVERIVPRNIR